MDINFTISTDKAVYIMTHNVSDSFDVELQHYKGNIMILLATWHSVSYLGGGGLTCFELKCYVQTQ